MARSFPERIQPLGPAFRRGQPAAPQADNVPAAGHEHHAHSTPRPQLHALPGAAAAVPAAGGQRGEDVGQEEAELSYQGERPGGGDAHGSGKGGGGIRARLHGEQPVV